jgi:hypothetical protein
MTDEMLLRVVKGLAEAYRNCRSGAMLQVIANLATELERRGLQTVPQQAEDQERG